MKEHYDTGKKLYLEHKFVEAIKEFDKIDLKDVGNFDESIVHHYKALCFAQLHKVRESDKSFIQAKKFRPNYSKIDFDRGITFYTHYFKNPLWELVLKLAGKKNKLEQALSCFEEGILIDNEDKELWYYRGYMLELLGNKKEALTCFEKCKDIDNIEESTLFSQLK